MCMKYDARRIQKWKESTNGAEGGGFSGHQGRHIA